jgi:hypothetical protein
VCIDSHALETALEYGIYDPIVTRARQLGEIFDAKCRPPFVDGSETLDFRADVVLDMGTSSANAEAAALDSRSVAFKSYQYSVNKVNIIFRRLLHKLGERSSELLDKLGEGKTIVVSPGFLTPSAYEGRSCVYVLVIKRKSFDSIYVGETESIQQRLSQHRSVVFLFFLW